MSKGEKERKEKKKRKERKTGNNLVLMARQFKTILLSVLPSVLEIPCTQVKRFPFYPHPIFRAYIFAEYLLPKHLIVQVTYSLLSVVSYNSVSLRGKAHFIQTVPSNPTPFTPRMVIFPVKLKPAPLTCPLQKLQMSDTLQSFRTRPIKLAS